MKKYTKRTAAKICTLIISTIPAVTVAAAAYVTNSVVAFDVACDYKRPLVLVDLDFVRAVTLPHSERDALVAFVVQLKIAKHVAVAKFVKYFV